jgi:hypothetical protein
MRPITGPGSHTHGHAITDFVKKQFPFAGNIGARKPLVSLSMTVQGLIKWRCLHQLSIWRAFFLPAF